MIEPTNPTIEISSWRTGPGGEHIAEYKFTARGMFVESLDLKHFPFDVQPLRISISSQAPAHVTFLKEDKLSPSALRPEFLVNPEFDIKHTMVLGHGARQRTERTVRQPFLVSDTRLVGNQNQKFVILHVAVIAKRIPTYYFWNVFVPMFLIVLMEGGAFVIDPGDEADRYSVTLTLSLVVVAYKCVGGELKKLAAPASHRPFRYVRCVQVQFERLPAPPQLLHAVRYVHLEVLRLPRGLSHSERVFGLSRLIAVGQRREYKNLGPRHHVGADGGVPRPRGVVLPAMPRLRERDEREARIRGKRSKDGERRPVARRERESLALHFESIALLLPQVVLNAQGAAYVAPRGGGPRGHMQIPPP